MLLSSIAAGVERQIGPDHGLDDGDIVIDDLLLEMELAWSAARGINLVFWYFCVVGLVEEVLVGEQAQLGLLGQTEIGLDGLIDTANWCETGSVGLG